MTPRTYTYWRRLALATLLAGAATFSASAFGDPAVACAAPREWDIAAFDACTARVDDAVTKGIISEQNWSDAYRQCCELSGGVHKPGTIGGDCVAPPAQEAERQPAPPAPPAAPGQPGLVDGGMTLYMPPPPGPAAPPPSEATLAP